MYSVQPTSQALRILGDDLRWRILRLLAREALNVTELTGVLGIAQSGVSRHLALLRSGGLVRETRRGGWAFYELPPEPPPGLEGLWSGITAELAAAADPHGDDARLAEVERARAEAGLAAGAEVSDPGRSWAAWSQALGHLLPAPCVVHLGARAGALTREAARWASSVTAVEPEADLVAQARRGGDAGGRIEWVQAGLEALPFPPATFDLALLAHALVRVDDPPRVLSEALRVVRPGGRVLVLDLLPHRQAWTRERHGHRRLGVAAADLTGWLEQVGWAQPRVEAGDRRRGNPFVALIASATKTAAAAGREA